MPADVFDDAEWINVPIEKGGGMHAFGRSIEWCILKEGIHSQEDVMSIDFKVGIYSGRGDGLEVSRAASTGDDR